MLGKLKDPKNSADTADTAFSDKSIVVVLQVPAAGADVIKEDKSIAAVSIDPADTDGIVCLKVPDADIIPRVHSMDVTCSAVLPNTRSQHADTTSLSALTAELSR